MPDGLSLAWELDERLEESEEVGVVVAGKVSPGEPGEAEARPE